MTKQADEPGRSHDDRSVLERINALAREEHELWERESSGDVTDADRKLLELGQSARPTGTAPTAQ